jgi:hypothetical protein
MPSFRALILGAPAGFVQRCLRANLIASESPEEFRTIIASELSPQDKTSDNANLNDDIIELVRFVRNCSDQCTDKPSGSEISAALQSSTVLSNETADIIGESVANGRKEKEQSKYLEEVVIKYSASCSELPPRSHSL